MLKQGKSLVVVSSLVVFASTACAQPSVYFTNIGPGFNALFGDSYGCFLDDTWQADLTAGPDPSALTPVGSPASFINSNGCGTGWFSGETIAVPGVNPDGTVYAKVRVWSGAETFDAARGAGSAWGMTPVVAVTTSGSGNYYLTGLQAPFVGPLTPWFMAKQINGDDFVYDNPLVLQRGRDIDLIVVIPLLAFRTSTGFQWQKLNSQSNWVDIAGANTNFLHLASVGPDDAGEYRTVFNFGCGCADQIGEAGITVIGMDASRGLTLNGPNGGKYRVDYLDQLGGTNAWQTLTNIVLSTGSASGIDTGFPNSTQRYYRVVYTR
jgi:hypothetical protein